MPVRSENPPVSKAIYDLPERPHSDDSDAPAALDASFARQLLALRSDQTNFDADCLAPTDRAVEALKALLSDAAKILRAPLPQGALYPDGDGGLRVEWRSSESTAVSSPLYLLLAVHPFDARQDYLYFQQGAARGALQADVTANLLAEPLRRLTG